MYKKSNISIVFNISDHQLLNLTFYAKRLPLEIWVLVAHIFIQTKPSSLLNTDAILIKPNK